MLRVCLDQNHWVSLLKARVGQPGQLKPWNAPGWGDRQERRPLALSRPCDGLVVEVWSAGRGLRGGRLRAYEWSDPPLDVFMCDRLACPTGGDDS
jgi:hypothetical protein